jgi:tetratricopeptide (TPR) repeat protein
MLGNHKFISNKISKLETLVVITMFISSISACTLSTYYRPTASSDKKTSAGDALAQLKQYRFYSAMTKGNGVAMGKGFTYTINEEGFIFDIHGEGVVKCPFESLDPEVKTVIGSFSVYLGPRCDWMIYPPEMTAPESIKLVNILYLLKEAEKEFAAEMAKEAAFANEAKRYREMRVKPTLPEDVHRYRLAAEDAFNNKHFVKALEYYKKGLAIEPLWPQGQFNAAMIAGELRQYGEAALHMKRYLELVPDANDAKFARENMYLWEVKAEEAGE